MVDHDFNWKWIDVFLKRLAEEHSPRQEAIIRLTLLANYRQATVARRWKVSRQDVCNIRRRALKNLKEMMGDAFPDRGIYRINNIGGDFE